MPTANKIELFARNNNLRPGWLSLGNQLGEQYNKPPRKTYCYECKEFITLGIRRFKSKQMANIDYCEKCF